MRQPIRSLNAANIETIKAAFDKSLDELGPTVRGKSGVRLLTSLKREKVGAGPYPEMSDLVIFNGIAGLLREGMFPFSEYTVEFGNEDNNGFDIRASSPSKTLIGEAFNVAPSFFQGKKASALRKLRGGTGDYKMALLHKSNDARVPPSPRRS